MNLSTNSSENEYLFHSTALRNEKLSETQYEKAVRMSTDFAQFSQSDSSSQILSYDAVRLGVAAPTAYGYDVVRTRVKPSMKKQ